MLILTRRNQEKIMIGDQIIIRLDYSYGMSPDLVPLLQPPYHSDNVWFDYDCCNGLQINHSNNLHDPIEVKILTVMKNQVRIGINAPKHISVHREEIYKKILKERNTPTGDSYYYSDNGKPILCKIRGENKND